MRTVPDDEIFREYARLRKLAFPERIRELHRQHRKKIKPANRRLWNRRYNSSPKGRACRRRYERTKKGKVAKKRWVEKNPAAIRDHWARRRARQVAGLVPGFQKAIKKIYDRAQELRQWFDVVVDHRIPLAKGGLHHPSNLQIIYRLENWLKRDRLDYQPSVIFT